MATISTINGVDIGNVAKINGIDIANIASVNGGDVATADFVATIDSTYVDSELTDFPIGIKLNAGDGFSGYGATDWQYLHATIGGSECYVEVDIWDTTANIAVLWVKVPTVSSSSDTVINLAITDVLNTATNVGETGDTPAQTVWDSNFVGVWHMSQDPSGGANSILDSTVNVNHGTPQGTMTSDDLIDGGFGKALEFDGANDFIAVLDSSDLDLDATKSMTLEGYVNSYIASVSDVILDKRDTNYGYLLGFHSSNSLHCYTKDGTDSVEPSGSTTLTRNGSAYYHSAGIFDRSTDIAKVFLNGTQDSSDVDMSAIDDCSNTSDLRIGHTTPTSSWGYFYGAISEARISDIVRSAAWIKATAQNLLGNLVAIS